MKRWLKQAAVWLACAGVVLPQSLFAAPQGQPQPVAEKSTPVVTDVALQDGGTLVGQVVDQQGQPIPKTAVVLRQLDQEVASTATDASGQFQVTGLRGGMYQVAAGEGVASYRVWAPRTAPPSAQNSALIVAGSDVIRGQQSKGLVYWLTNPWVLATLVAAAITIPIALNNNDSSS